jgi:hypothetical protein
MINQRTRVLVIVSSVCYQLERNGASLKPKASTPQFVLDTAAVVIDVLDTAAVVIDEMTLLSDVICCVLFVSSWRSP